MNYKVSTYNGAIVRQAIFATSGANAEQHAMATIADNSMSFTEQLSALMLAIESFVCEQMNLNFRVVAIRLLLSDAANQAQQALDAIAQTSARNAALAYVEQPPLNGTKIAALIYMQQNATVERIDEYTVQVRRNGLTHLWSGNICSPSADTLGETYAQLGYLERMLANKGFDIATSCVRTWFYVQNIDVNYASVVKARRDNFNQNGLTVDTHYITSTGIGGRHASKDVTSILDAYSVGGMHPDQMQFLYASNNMNRTSDYGVTFERGTTVDYADRRQIYISGTASINNRGDIVAPGDIVAQTNRMIENVEALFAEAGASMSDVAHIVVYLRDVADYGVVSGIFGDRFPDVPTVITLAPVCRPGWLIEMECMGIVPRTSAMPQF